MSDILYVSYILNKKSTHILICIDENKPSNSCHWFKRVYNKIIFVTAAYTNVKNDLRYIIQLICMPYNHVICYDIR